MLGDNYTNQTDINAEGDLEDLDPVLIEVESYLKERPLDREESPLGWWKENHHGFPIIS